MSFFRHCCDLGLRDGERASRKSGDDLLTVKAAVFDKDFTGMVSANDYASQIQTRNIAFEGLRVESRLIGLRIELDAELAQKIEVGMVSGKGKNMHSRQCRGTARAADMHGIRLDADDMSLKQGRDLASLDAIFNVRPNPIFYGRAEFGAPVHHGDAGAAAIEVESSFRGGIFPSDDDNVLSPEWMRLGVVVRDMRQIQARQDDGQVVEAGGDNELAAVGLVRAVPTQCRRKSALHSSHFAQAQLEF